MQALFRQAIAKGAATRRNAKDNPEKHMVLLRVMALALLPPTEIRDVFLEIVKDTNERFPKHNFNAFFNYVEEYWLDRRGVDTFCVFEQAIRTNNAIESYHRDLNSMMHMKRPTVWHFIGNLFLFIHSLLKVKNCYWYNS